MAAKPLLLTDVSEGLRTALEEGLRQQCHYVRGVGADGARYQAVKHQGRVFIEVLPYHPRGGWIAEPAGIRWKPLRRGEAPVPREAASEGLQKALEEGAWPDGRRRAIGIGLDGSRYDANLCDDGVHIFADVTEARVWIGHLISEPEEVVWRAHLPNDSRLRFEEVSAELRSALEAAYLPHGRRLASGVGPDGRHYDASLHDHWVNISETLHFTSFGMGIPEPEGVAWRPLASEQDWVRLGDVSEGLREALAKRHRFRGEGDLAKGVGLNGTEYRAWLWNDRLVLIHFADDTGLRADGTPLDYVPMPEPAGVVWEPWSIWQELREQRHA